MKKSEWGPLYWKTLHCMAIHIKNHLFSIEKQQIWNNINKILIKKYDIINDCYLKAEYFIGLSSNSLSIFPDTKEKEILKKLTSFSLE